MVALTKDVGSLIANDAGLYEVGQSDERPWGTWLVISVGEGYISKRIEVLPGKRLSLQYHHFRQEHWVIVSGEGVVEIDGSARLVSRNSHVHIPLGKTHRIQNTGDQPLVFIETQIGSPLLESDIVRIEDDFGRE